MIKKYYAVEKIFENHDIHEERNLLNLRRKDLTNLKEILCISLSHANIVAKNKLVTAILHEYEPLCQDSSKMSLKFRAVIHDLASLESKWAKEVSVKARSVLLRGIFPPIKKRKEHIKTLLQLHIKDTGAENIHSRNIYSCMRDFGNLIHSNLIQLQDLFFFWPSRYGSFQYSI